MDKDGLTVVIPTYNRKDLLACTLDSLYQQGPYHSRFEVIVVDDGSSDGTESLALDYSNRLDLRYCFQPDKGFRVAAARNMGIRHARFRAILFIDAGIVVSSRLLGLHYQHQGSTSS